MGKQRRKYSIELKMELVERVLAGASALEVARDEEISPSLIKKWKREYLDGKFHGTSASDSELKKLQLKNCKLEQMVGKLTMGNYLLKKEKEYLAARRKEISSQVSGPNSNQPGRWQN
ncbi:MAG: transposase [Actinomycetia bacterium]|nr:transposase [Actinomycetes bacterium]